MINHLSGYPTDGWFFYNGRTSSSVVDGSPAALSWMSLLWNAIIEALYLALGSGVPHQNEKIGDSNRDRAVCPAEPKKHVPSDMSPFVLDQPPQNEKFGGSDQDHATHHAESKKHVLSDLPPFVFDQILGNSDASYLVIRLWLVGDKTLQDKLSRGLTYLDLKRHRFALCHIPHMIARLRSLRHFSHYAETSLRALYLPYCLPARLRSLPSTLEYLALNDIPFNADEAFNRIESTYSRGASVVIELETLFPNLHTLKLKIAPHDLFPALPTSLTRLEGHISLDYFSGADTHSISKLPPGLLHLTGPVDWTLEDRYRSDNAYFLATTSDVYCSEEAVDAIRLDFANAPPGLQTINVHRHVRWSRPTELHNSSYTFWLPKTLVEIDWTPSNCPPWAPILARSMPPNLHTLLLGEINLEAYATANSNWVEDLPRSITKLAVSPENRGMILDFASYGRFLPPGLTSLELATPERHSFGRFGDWSKITGIDYWPSKLSTLGLLKFWIEPSDIIHLPRTLSTLSVSVSSSNAASKIGDTPQLCTDQLPPRLTSLNLAWTSLVNINVSLKHLPLKKCTLQYQEPINQSKYFPYEILHRFSDTLTYLKLANICITPPSQKEVLELPLPNLTSLKILATHCKLFKFIPRNVRYLSIKFISGIPESPLLRAGQLFQHLPASLSALILKEAWSNLQNDFELPPQRLDHLRSLLHLRLTCVHKVSSGMLKQLPQSLKHLDIKITELKDDDAPFIPPRLITCLIPNVTLALVQNIPIAALAGINADKSPVKVSHELEEIAQERVSQASIHQ